MNAQADLSLRRAHMSESMFFHVTDLLILLHFSVSTITHAIARVHVLTQMEGFDVQSARWDTPVNPLKVLAMQWLETQNRCVESLVVVTLRT